MFISEDDLDIITRHKTAQKQNTELFFRMKRCDARKEPFKKFCETLEENDHSFISDKLKKTVGEMAQISSDSSQKKHQKCTYCILVDNLYPDKIAAALYEDSGLSSGALEEVTLTEGVTRREAVKTILKKLFNYQIEKGPGREYIEALAKSLPDTLRIFAASSTECEH